MINVSLVDQGKRTAEARVEEVDGLGHVNVRGKARAVGALNEVARVLGPESQVRSSVERLDVALLLDVPDSGVRRQVVLRGPVGLKEPANNIRIFKILILLSCPSFQL
jgi:hypothetical protein